jgi:hypothetical protein
MQAAEFAGKFCGMLSESSFVICALRCTCPPMDGHRPGRSSWFIPDCSYEHNALFPTLTNETADWLEIWVFIYQITWGLVLDDSNYREK